MIDLTTRYSDEIAEIPTIQRGLRPTAAPGLIVGREEPVACPPPACTAPNPPSPLSVSPAVTAKPERIAEGGPVKARQRAPSRHERRVERDRLARFRDAALFAYAMDWPLNVGLTITWTALQVAGERNEGHCLGRGEWAREKYTRNELARLCRSEGLPFVALWGRDVGADMGSHVHLSMFWPSYKLDRLIAVIERISGSSADFVRKRCAAGVVARSVCGGWQINMNTREDDKQGALEWAEYIASQHAKHPAPPKIRGKAFGISEAIGKTAQERARPMLEAREAKYGWIRRAATESP